MQALNLEDRRCLQAAEGWLGLGSWQEANAELENITPRMREHPVVLCMHWNIHAAASQWELAAAVARRICQALPEMPLGWLQLAHSLHALSRTEEARQVLLPLVPKFPGQYLMRYKLACYACHLGHLNEARQWLETALELADSDDVQKMAQEEPDLRPLWSQCSHAV